MCLSDDSKLVRSACAVSKLVRTVTPVSIAFRRITKPSLLCSTPCDGVSITRSIKAEPDGSSFPSGGIRETCAARGYTVWDCTSPAFVKEIPDGCKVLCIPTIFISYTGESLDHKTPLLRSMDAVNKQALRILKLFGKTPAKVTASVGPEQEYFLIDKDKFNQRLDLKLTGRTLFGAPAPKGQELDDQYFGVIKDKVSHFMRELNKDLCSMSGYR